MDWLRILLHRCTAIFRRRKLDEELDQEFAAHIDLLVEEKLRSGLSADDARSGALREFGGVTQIRENYRTQRGVAWAEHLRRDLSFGWRQLAKSPSFTLTAVLTLALGIGANTAVFSVLSALLLRPLPFAHSDRLVRIYSVIHNERVDPSPLDSRDFARQNRTFEHLAVFDQWRKNIITSKRGDNAENVNVGLGNLDLFQALGIQPVIGRLFTAEEGLPGRNHVVLITESFWQSHYTSDPAIIGRTIIINGEPYSIIGILPRAIPGWLRGISHPLEVWEPFLPVPRIWDDTERAERGFTAVGLLRESVTLPEAQADLETIAANLAASYPIDHGVGVLVQPLVDARAADLKPQLYLLMGAVTLILLIACSNLAALLLARNTARQREFAMRAALGAKRLTLVRQILVETMLLSLLGGGCGVAVASAIDTLIRHRHPASIPELATIGLDWHVLLFTIVIALATSLIFGIMPAILNTKINFAEALKLGARGASAPLRHLFRNALVIGQIALSLVLAVSAALFMQTILHLQHQDFGFRVNHLLKGHFFLPPTQYPTADAITRFCDRFAEQLRAVPGVSNVSITTIYPPYERWDMMFTVEGRPVSRTEDVPSTFFGVTDTHYLKTTGIRLVEGRDFSPSDREDAPVVAIVNQNFVRRFLPDVDPLGRRINLGSPPNLAIKDRWLGGDDVPATIVGIMADSKNDGLTQPIQPQMITLFRQMPRVNYGFKDVIVRSEVAPDALERAVRQKLHDIDPLLPLSEVSTMTEHIEALTADKQFTSFILLCFAASGLVLAAVGIYGVVSFLVAQRNHEFAIRLALGAHRSDVLELVLRQGIRLAAAGIAIGLVATALAGHALSGLLYQVSAFDTFTLSAVSLVLLAVALAASALPARRAASIDPTKALLLE
jgi:putative ABC transport system permease protein